jgi:hypothetical protein
LCAHRGIIKPRDGLQQQDEPSEVRNLSHNAEARAEEAMRQMMAKPQSKRRGY